MVHRHRAIFIVFCFSLLAVACKRDEASAPATAAGAAPEAGRSATVDAGRPNCRFIDGSARVECDDDPKGESPRVRDCTWEWADDPCPDAKPGVDQRRQELKRPTTVK